MEQSNSHLQVAIPNIRQHKIRTLFSNDSIITSVQHRGAISDYTLFEVFGQLTKITHSQSHNEFYLSLSSPLTLESNQILRCRYWKMDYFFPTELEQKNEGRREAVPLTENLPLRCIGKLVMTETGIVLMCFAVRRAYRHELDIIRAIATTNDFSVSKKYY